MAQDRFRCSFGTDRYLFEGISRSMIELGEMLSIRHVPLQLEQRHQMGSSGDCETAMSPLKPRLTIFITAFPPETEGFLKLTKCDGLHKCPPYFRVALITNHDMWSDHALQPI